MKKITFIAFLFILSFSFGKQALACSCAEPLSIADTYVEADVVFSGIVASFHDRVGAEDTYKDAEFVVYDSFKGNENDPRTVIVGTNAFSAACGSTFIEGREYLVYATLARDGKMYTNSCGRTKLISSAEDELESLFNIQNEFGSTNSKWNEPQPLDPTVEVTSESESVEPSSNSALVVGMIAIGIVGLGLLVGTIFYFAKRK